MASQFTPFSNFEGGLIAFSGGFTFAPSTGFSNSLVSMGYQYLAGISYCGPYCLAVSYVISLGVGSVSARSVNNFLRSYFLEKYKAEWLLENQSKYYVENNVLRRIPVIPVPFPGLPEGLAFISLKTTKTKVPSIISGNSALSTSLRIAIVCTISKAFLFVSGKVVQKLVTVTESVKDPLKED